MSQGESTIEQTSCKFAVEGVIWNRRGSCPNLSCSDLLLDQQRFMRWELFLHEMTGCNIMLQQWLQHNEETNSGCNIMGNQGLQSSIMFSGASEEGIKVCQMWPQCHNQSLPFCTLVHHKKPSGFDSDSVPAIS